MSRYPIRYSPVKGTILRLVLLPQRFSYVDVGKRDVNVRMGYGFRASFARSNVAHVSREKPVLLTAGAHGWRGRWLVNGASRPIVSIKLHEQVRAHVLGVPVTLNEVQ